MSARAARVLFWSPHILAMLFAAFISLFALDVFGEGVSFWQAIPGLLFHLIPTYLILIALFIGWRWPLAGAILFTALALAYLLVARTEFPWFVYAMMMGPPLLIALLFFLSWRFRPAQG